MERNSKQVGCNAHDNNALVVRGSGSNRLDSMEKERRPFLFYFSSFFSVLGLGVWFGSNNNRSDGNPPPPPYQCNTSIREDAKWEQMGPDSWGWRIFFSCFLSLFFLGGGVENRAFLGGEGWFRLMLCIFFFLLICFFVAASDPLHLLIDHLSCLLNCRCCCFFKRKKKKSSRPK